MSYSRPTVGQVWRGHKHWYVVGRVDNFEIYDVISVSAFNDAELASLFAGHMPLSQETFRENALELVTEGENPHDLFEQGYEFWRAAFEEGGAPPW